MRCGEDFLSLSPRAAPHFFIAYFSFSRSITRRDPDTPDTDALALESTGLSSPTGIDAISSASSSASHEVTGKDAPIGLSDPQFVGHRRQMLDYVNRLRATG